MTDEEFAAAEGRLIGLLRSIEWQRHQMIVDRTNEMAEARLDAILWCVEQELRERQSWWLLWHGYRLRLRAWRRERRASKPKVPRLPWRRPGWHR